jgi:hypothetical protein
MHDYYERYPMRWPIRDARLWETRLWDGLREKHAYEMAASAPSPAARPSLDTPLGCPYVAPVLPLRSAYLARPIVPFFPEFSGSFVL